MKTACCFCAHQFGSWHFDLRHFAIVDAGASFAHFVVAIDFDDYCTLIIIKAVDSAEASLGSVTLFDS